MVYLPFWFLYRSYHKICPSSTNNISHQEQICKNGKIKEKVEVFKLTIFVEIFTGGCDIMRLVTEFCDDGTFRKGTVL